MRIQLRIALMFAILTVSIVLAGGAVEYYFANQNAFEDFYKRLEIRAIIAGRAKLEETGLSKKALEDIRKQHLETLPNEKEYFIRAEELEQFRANSMLKVNDLFYKDILEKGKARYRDHDIFYLGYLYRNTGGNYLIIVSAKNEFIDAYLNNLLRIILISVAFSAVLSSVIGLWFSNMILRPIRMITRKTQDISATQLHLRLPVSTGKDELAGLADTFNNMLDRLEAAFETQKNFISNASHELNTPLTTIIGESEFALSRLRSPKEYTESINAILNEAERLKKIISSLLHLAQTGYNGKAQEFKQLRLDEIIYTVKATVDNIIPDNNIYINLSLMPEDEGKLIINGNQQLLELALVNIVINACKYSSNKPVYVTMAAANLKVIIIIEDQGIGIPSNEIAYIYEPFFRASNTGKFNGYGIGLPLSRNIIRMHNGLLEVTSEENIGTKIKITLPLAFPDNQ